MTYLEHSHRHESHYYSREYYELVRRDPTTKGGVGYERRLRPEGANVFTHSADPLPDLDQFDDYTILVALDTYTNTNGHHGIVVRGRVHHFLMRGESGQKIGRFLNRDQVWLMDPDQASWAIAHGLEERLQANLKNVPTIRQVQLNQPHPPWLYHDTLDAYLNRHAAKDCSTLDKQHFKWEVDSEGKVKPPSAIDPKDIPDLRYPIVEVYRPPANIKSLLGLDR